MIFPRLSAPHLRDIAWNKQELWLICAASGPCFSSAIFRSIRIPLGFWWVSGHYVFEKRTVSQQNENRRCVPPCHGVEEVGSHAARLMFNGPINSKKQWSSIQPWSGSILSPGHESVSCQNQIWFVHGLVNWDTLRKSWLRTPPYPCSTSPSKPIDLSSFPAPTITWAATTHSPSSLLREWFSPCPFGVGVWDHSRHTKCLRLLRGTCRAHHDKQTALQYTYREPSTGHFKTRFMLH